MTRSSIEVGSACLGSGQCEMLAPEVFQVGDDGRSHVREGSEWPPGIEDAVRDALLSCPVRALREM